MSLMQGIRDRSKGLVMWFMVLVIGVPFALWGIQDYLIQGGSRNVIEVNGKEVNYYEYNRIYREQRAQAPKSLDDTAVKERVIEGIIDRELLAQSAMDNGIRASDQQLVEAIQNDRRFSNNDQFSMAAYKQALAQQGLSTEDYEIIRRQELSTSQFFTMLQMSGVASREIASLLDDAKKQRRLYQTLLIPRENFVSSDPIAVEKIEQHYEANQNRFTLPEQVAIEYIELSRSKVEEGIEVSETELETYFERQKKMLTVPEERLVSHILIKQPKDADASAKASAAALINEAAAKLGAGEDFATLAKEISQDAGSSRTGGELGWLAKGDLEEPLSKTVFALEQGAVSEPVQGRNGWHVFKLLDIQAEEVPNFEGAREQLIKNIRETKMDELFTDRISRLEELSFDYSDSLDEVSQDLELPILLSAPFDRNGSLVTQVEEGAESIASHAEIRQAAFADSVFVDGENSPLIEVGEDKIVVLRVKDKIAARQQSLEEVKEDIVQAIYRENSLETAKKATEETLARLNDGVIDKSQAAQELRSFWSEVKESTRKDADPTIKPVLFSMPTPETGKESFASIDLYNNFMIVALNQVDDGYKKMEADTEKVNESGRPEKSNDGETQGNQDSANPDSTNENEIADGTEETENTEAVASSEGVTDVDVAKNDSVSADTDLAKNSETGEGVNENTNKERQESRDRESFELASQMSIDIFRAYLKFVRDEADVTINNSVINDEDSGYGQGY